MNALLVATAQQDGAARIIVMEDVRSKAFLVDHISRIASSFEAAGVVDPTGGFHNQLRDDGSNYDRDLKHVVGTARFVYVYGVFATNEPDAAKAAAHRAAMRHGLGFLRHTHIVRDGVTGCPIALDWTLQRRRCGGDDDRFEEADGSQYTYAVAFCILALASALTVGLGGDDAKALEIAIRTDLELLWNWAETRFYDAAGQLYVDQFTSRDATAPTAYRGQNCNMHMCEALLFAHRACPDETKYLRRSYGIAKRITKDLAIDERCGGRATLWEHFNAKWEPDYAFNAEAPKGSEEYMFRPWGLQPGHFFEWSKLLIQLDDAFAEVGAAAAAASDLVPAAERAWMLPRSRDLFWRAHELGWSNGGGGGGETECTVAGAAYLVHPFATDTPGLIDSDRFYWVHNEMLAAAGLLAQATAAGRVTPRESQRQREAEWLLGPGSEIAYEDGAQEVWEVYSKGWSFCTQHFVDQTRGGWFPMLETVDRDGGGGSLCLQRVKRPFGLDGGVAASDGAAEERAGVWLWPSKTEYHPVAMAASLLDSLF